MLIALEDSTVVVQRPSEEAQHKSRHGLTRTLVAKWCRASRRGSPKSLEIQGVGYKAEPKPFGVQLVVGFRIPSPTTRHRESRLR